MGNLSGKTALVTGGGTGIGKAIVEMFVKEGVNVFISGRRGEPLKQVANAHGGKVKYIQADMSEPAQVRRAVSAAVEAFGRLDVLVNNAGVFLMKPLTECTDADIAQQLSVNLGGTLIAIREAIPHLIKTKGNVINISSTAGQGVFSGTAAYSAAKAGMDHATRCLAVELGPLGIRVNVVSPGMTDTDMAAPITASKEMSQHMIGMTPLRRLGKPEDIAKAAVFLASDEASWITGQVVQSSGGLLL